MRVTVAALEKLATGIGIAGTVAACLLIPLQVVLGVGYIIARQLLIFQLTPLQELEWHFFFFLVFLTLGAAYLIGNPPWLAYHHMTGKMQKVFRN